MDNLRKKLITAIVLICVLVLALVVLRGCGTDSGSEASDVYTAGTVQTEIVDPYADAARAYIWPLYEGEDAAFAADMTILETSVQEAAAAKKSNDNSYTKEVVVEVEESGLYKIAVAYQNKAPEAAVPTAAPAADAAAAQPAAEATAEPAYVAKDTTVEIAIDGATPDEALNAVVLPSSENVAFVTLKDAAGEDLVLRLARGTHVVRVYAKEGGIVVPEAKAEAVETFPSTAVITVPENAQYALVLQYANHEGHNGASTVELLIDGKAPFTEMQAHELPAAAESAEMLLTDADGEAYMFCLTAGEHTVGMNASAGSVHVTGVTVKSLQLPVYAGEDVRFEQTLALALGQSGEMTVTAPEDGRYQLWLDYINTVDTTLPTEMTVLIDGEVISEEMQRVKLNSEWVDQYYTTGVRDYATDRYGNEIATEPEALKEVRSAGISDSTARTADPMLIPLTAGEHVISFSVQDGGVELSALTLKAPATIAPYVQGDASGKNIIVIEAEDIHSRSESSIRGAGEFSAELSPYSNDNRLINFLDGASFDAAGDIVTWKFNVAETGWYNLGAFYRQSARADFPTYVDIYVDGVIPTAGAQRVAFPYTTSFSHMQAKTAGGDNLTLYLEKGDHTLSFRINSEHLTPTYKAIDYLLEEINDLSNDVKSIVGGATADPYRDYNMLKNFPDLVDRLTYWSDMAADQVDYSKQFAAGGSGSAFSSMTLCADQLARLAEEPENLPRRMSEFSTGANSAARMLAQQLTDMAINDLSIDQIYLYQNSAKLPAKPNFFQDMWAGVERFFSSFTTQDYVAGGSETTWKDEDGTEHPVIQVWVGRSRQYVELMQQMADTEFYEETGIRVNLSLMPDANKLVLANAAGTAPDAVLGLQYVVPSYLNIRGALYDLTQIEDIANADGTVTPGFGAVAQRFSSGLFIPYTLKDGVYAMPETVNFWVMFYRKDILESLQIEVPDSMDQVKLILPELQRRSMNFYFPTAGMVGTKVFPGTLPLILQSGGSIYAETIGDTTLDSEISLQGFREMTELFTIYNMPTDVPSPGFYQQFRDGTLPIGVADLGTYNLLLNAAPELDGLWDIALFPGLTNAEGEVERWTTGGAETMAIMTAAQDHGRVDEAWKFLEWWSRRDTQSNFGNLLQSTYGSEYIWPTANTEAFAQLPLRSAHKQVIIEQMEWMTEAPWVLGTYMLERELSNAFISVTADGVEARRAMDTAVKRINRETYRKLEEFGYYKDGQMLEDFPTPSAEVVEKIIEEYNAAHGVVPAANTAEEGKAE